jgi:hypothetical protein
MKPLYLLTAGLLAAFLSGGAAAQFNTDALKKMQKEGHKIVEEQEAAEAAASAQSSGEAVAADKSVEKASAQMQPTAAPVARTVYRYGAKLCLNAGDALTIEACNGKAASQQWALNNDGRLVAHDGRCVAGASLVKCAGGKNQKWVYDKRGRLRNQSQQCLQAGGEKAGARVSAPACSGKATQVWTEG